MDTIPISRLTVHKWLRMKRLLKRPAGLQKHIINFMLQFAVIQLVQKLQSCVTMFSFFCSILRYSVNIFMPYNHLICVQVSTVVLFLGFLTKILYKFLIPSMHNICPAFFLMNRIRRLQPKGSTAFFCEHSEEPFRGQELKSNSVPNYSNSICRVSFPTQPVICASNLRMLEIHCLQHT